MSAFILLLLSGCFKRSPADEYTDTPTTGNVGIAVDETLEPVIDAELQVFHAVYQYANIRPKYLPEAEAIKLLLLDSVRLAITSRPLNEKEKAYFHSRKFFPQEVPFAVDGIAVLVNQTNSDTLFTVSQLRKIMLGEITEWKQLNPDSKLGKIQLVFDHPESSIVRFVADSIIKKGKFSSEISAMERNTDVADFVSKTPEAIGLIGVSWISDSRNPEILTLHKKIRVAAISAAEIASAQNSFQPFQADIATGKYPLTRFLYLIVSEPRAGLGTGLTSFISSDKGQRIILKTGILPYTRIERNVTIKAE